jgi:hypothetical protein
VPGFDQNGINPILGYTADDWSILTSPPVHFRSILKNKRWTKLRCEQPDVNGPANRPAILLYRSRFRQPKD